MNPSSPEEPITYLGVSITPEAIECEIDGQSYLSFNGPEGHARLLSRLGAPARTLRISCEQAEGAEARLVAALHDGGFTVAVVPAAEVCAAADLRDASEISARILADYSATHPERLKFIEGRRHPRPPTLLRPRRPLRRLSLWTQWRKWLARWPQRPGWVNLRRRLAAGWRAFDRSPPAGAPHRGARH